MSACAHTDGFNMADYWRGSPERLRKAMIEAGLWRAYLVRRAGGDGVVASDPLFESIAAEVSGDTRDYRAHQGCFFEIGAESGHLLSAYVHRTTRGQAAGGVRFWHYERVADWVRDGLRLSLGMGQKSALAGLWWGGGKGVIARRPGVDHRDDRIRAQIYRDFGRFISGLHGVYVTAEDAGTCPADMAWVHTTTRHTTCIPAALGGSGNPSIATAKGVVVAIEAALDHLGAGPLAGKTLVLQGLGQVSRAMIGELLQRQVSRIIGSDIDSGAVDAAQQRYGGAPLELSCVAPDSDEAFMNRADVFVPNAVGGVLNPRTIPRLQAPLVCGAANNQLEDPRRDGALLTEQGILYVPDFLANRMGIVNCANEQYGTLTDDPAITAHFDRDNPSGIYQRTLEVLRRADRSGRTPVEEAEQLAEELAGVPHPLWGNRGQQIIDDLVASRWQASGPIAPESASTFSRS